MHLNMVEFFKKTFLPLSPYLLISLVIGYFIEEFNPIANVYLRFGINGMALIISYFAIMWLFAFNSYEKKLLFGTVKRLLK